VPISRETRRDIGDTILIRGLPWSGAMDEVAFLGRLFEIDKLPSFDPRFKSASNDVWQHRVNNPNDWDDDWVFYDSRFNVLGGDDENLLAFLSEMLHPLVRRGDGEATAELAEEFNQLLRRDGSLSPARRRLVGFRSGRPAPSPRTAGCSQTRPRGSSTCSTPTTVPIARSVRRLLGNLAQIVQALAELRNAYGTGHGKGLGQTQLAPRHAALAVNASVTLATFLFQTHEDRLE
jgi:AbiJ N-terminal domain 3/Abortive infection C-terminus